MRQYILLILIFPLFLLIVFHLLLMTTANWRKVIYKAMFDETTDVLPRHLKLFVIYKKLRVAAFIGLFIAWFVKYIF